MISREEDNNYNRWVVRKKLSKAASKAASKAERRKGKENEVFLQR